jgi:hypothetical protein
VTDARVVLNRQFFDARENVEMADADVVVNQTFAGVDDAHAESDAFPDFVAKEPTIKAAFQKRRQRREQSQYQQTGSACSLHPCC